MGKKKKVLDEHDNEELFCFGSVSDVEHLAGCVMPLAKRFYQCEA